MGAGRHMSGSQPFVMIRTPVHDGVLASDCRNRGHVSTAGFAQAHRAARIVSGRRRRGASLRWELHCRRHGNVGLHLERARVAKRAWQVACAGFRHRTAALRSAELGKVPVTVQR